MITELGEAFRRLIGPKPKPAVVRVGYREINDLEIITTTLRNRCGSIPALWSIYDARLDAIANRMPRSRDFPLKLSSWIDALEDGILREEFSMLEDVIGYDA